jgi:hypothetical protein
MRPHLHCSLLAVILASTGASFGDPQPSSEPTPYCLQAMTPTMANEIDSPCIVRALGERSTEIRPGSYVYGLARQGTGEFCSVVIEKAVVVDGGSLPKGSVVDLVSTSTGVRPIPSTTAVYSFHSGPMNHPSVAPLRAGQCYFVVAMAARNGRLLQPRDLVDTGYSPLKIDRRQPPSEVAGAPYVSAEHASELALLNAFPTSADKLARADSPANSLFLNFLNCLEASNGRTLIALTNFMREYRLHYRELSRSPQDDAWSLQLKALASKRKDPLFQVHLYKLLMVWNKPDVLGPFVNGLMDLGSLPNALAGIPESEKPESLLGAYVPHSIVELSRSQSDSGLPFDAFRANELALTAGNPEIRHYLQEECMTPPAAWEMPRYVARLDKETGDAQEALLRRLAVWMHLPDKEPHNEIRDGVLHVCVNREELMRYWKARFPAKKENP